MDLDELQSVRDRERQTDKLQQLRTSFYADAGEFIQQLREQRDHAAERADDPFDAPEVNRLTDEIKTAEQTVEAIYEKRVGKIVKAASFAAADLPAEVDGMTEEEEDLFESLVSDIKQNRRRVLDVLAGEADSSPTDTGSETDDGPESDAPANPSSGRTPSGSRDETSPSGSPTGSPSPSRSDDGGSKSGVTAADLMGEGGDDTDRVPPEPGRGDGESVPEPPENEASGTGVSSSESTDRSSTESGSSAHSTPESESSSTEERPVRNDGGATADPAVDRSTVRITDDVGAILGVDQREYDLSTDDVVTLPAENVEPLLEQGAATRLD